jgi:adenylosuccinate lyase
MIPRYTRKIMADIWSDKNKYDIWFKIEAYALEAMAADGLCTKQDIENVWNKSDYQNGFDIARIDEIERETKHDVIAFLTHVSERVGESARFLHQGMTSSDVLDTCLALQLKQAGQILLDDLDRVLEALKRRAFETKNLVCIGRSHGIHAEPTTFGLKFASFYAEFARNKHRLEAAIKDVSTCAISGAVGTFANIDPKVQSYVANKLGLEEEPISSQVIPRDRHAVFFNTLGVIASSIERLAIEIRHLQRTEVLEAEESFTKGQKGSSAMPHKKNPILSENITGLARIVRGYCMPAMENVALWHERDISHSSVERMIAPDATVTLDFALNRMVGLIDGLVIHFDNVEKNLNKLGGIFYSQRVLLHLTRKGLSREDSYALVQKNSMRVWNEGKHLLDCLLEDADVAKYLNEQELSNLFRLEYHIKNVDYIFDKVFKG